jgi:pectate lyase
MMFHAQLRQSLVLAWVGVLAASGTAWAQNGTGLHIETRVQASADDAEESALGAVDHGSSDLELVLEDSTQLIGIRFDGVAVPQGATIRDPAPWPRKGESGPDQRTPDVSPIVQEIVSRPGWSRGNALVLFVSGSGKRVAESFDGTPSGAPLLSLRFASDGSEPPPPDEPPPPVVPGLPAFPGAEGFGSHSVGGRGGRVIQVTNLNDDGPGSLRAALEASGPRIVVFRVAGTLELDSSIEVQNPYVTLAGQTAPGQGITLKNSSRNAKTPLKLETHDVIVRYIRSRPGSNLNETGTLDALTISNDDADVYNVIVDHGSFSWATDEVTNIYYDSHDITVQWSIIAEGLDCSTHIENGERQCHSMGMLLGSDGSRDYSIHHNFFAHNRNRNPRIKTMGTVDVVNNVVYNSGTGNGWRSATYVHGERAVVPANYIANYFKPGPDSGAAAWFIDTAETVRIYAEGNAVPNAVIDPDSRSMLVDTRHPAPAITTTSAAEAYEQVLAEAGASRGLNCDGTVYVSRDSVDARIVNEAVQGTGKIINEPEEVGGWPELLGGTPCPDSDRDGMPDEFEVLHGFDPEDPTDGSRDSDGDGYTNVEEFLNSTTPRETRGGPSPPRLLSPS